MKSPLLRIPRIQRALVATRPGALALKPVAVPQIHDDEVLVRVAAVALNPSDHKLLDQSTTAGAVSGSDFAGTVVQVGSDVGSHINVGDRVFGLVFGANPDNPGNGAWAQYVAAPADLCVRIPDGMDFAAASSMAMGIGTAGLAFRSLGLNWERLTDPSTSTDSDATDKEYVLVHGGATATGTLTIQLLRLAGYAPIATCSPRNYDLVKGRGAVAAFDYNSPSCHNEIRKYTNDSLRYAFDCIANVATMTLCYTALGEQGGHYAALEQYPRSLTIRRRDVHHDWILGWTLFGKEVKLGGAYHRPAMPEDRAFARDWMEIMGGLVKGGLLQPHPLDITRGTLSAVLPRLAQLRNGEIKGKKMVVQVQLT